MAQELAFYSNGRHETCHMLFTVQLSVLQGGSSECMAEIEPDEFRTVSHIT